ncbi:MAG TPA: GerMN domain-containing protein [Actinoplanes sp.]|nr:GerMN domain-containing protein [Actinoplanes sp.]
MSIESEPRAVEAPPGPFPGLASPIPAQSGALSLRLCFVRDGRLTAVTRKVRQQVSPDEHLRALISGPDDAESAAGYTSALTATNLAAGARQAGSVVTVEVGDRPQDTGRSDEVLAFGQVVCTLTARSHVTAVAFTQEGRPLAVPRADGSLSAQPLTTVDYADLLVPN